MKLGLFISTFFLSTLCAAQEFKYYNEFHEKADSINFASYSIAESDGYVAIEKYYSNNDSLIKTKTFEVIDDSNHLREIKYYYMGILRSFVDHYSLNDKKPDSSLTYYPNGKLYRIEFYDSALIAKNICYDTVGNQIPFKKLRETNFFDCPFTVMDLYKWLSMNVEYPREAREMGLEGKMKIELIFESDGLISKTNILKSIHPLFDEAVLSAIKKLNYFNCPKIIDGIYVKSHFRFPLEFAQTN